VTSPTNEADIVVAELPTNATVPAIYEVFVVAHGKPVTHSSPVFRSDYSGPPQVQWIDATVVMIQCDRARVWHSQNFESIAVGSDRFADVTIVLQCGVTGYTPR